MTLRFFFGKCSQQRSFAKPIDLLVWVEPKFQEQSDNLRITSFNCGCNQAGMVGIANINTNSISQIISNRCLISLAARKENWMKAYD